MLEKYQSGDFPDEGWERKVREDNRRYVTDYRCGLFKSFKIVAICFLIAFAGAFAFGKINLSYPLDMNKVFSLTGGFFAAWATLFELGGFAGQGWKGNQMHEIARPVIFMALFLPGLVLASLGQL